MSGKLEGRRILVTGAASGMGRGIAELFAEEGAALALLDRNREGVEAVAATVGAHGYGCDVTDRAGTAKAVTTAIDALGGLDGVVNGAGVLVTKPFDELEPEAWDMMLAVNLTGPFNILKAAIPALRREARATIVNIASVSGLMPMAGTSGYSASKGGVIMFGKALAFDLGPRIRCNTICPGVIRTEMTRFLWENPEHVERAEQRVALKRLGDPGDVARTALYLTSEDSGFTTGTEIPVDGGFSWR